MGTTQYYLPAIGLNMPVIWGYLKFCWFMLDFHKYIHICENLTRTNIFVKISCVIKRINLKPLKNYKNFMATL